MKNTKKEIEKIIKELENKPFELGCDRFEEFKQKLEGLK